MLPVTRRGFLQSSLAAGVATFASRSRGAASSHSGIPTGERPRQDPSVRVLNPRDRVPVGFIIDDSTCLVNMGAYCMPQFATAWPDRAEYKKPWASWPREIPDAFVREFGEWCAGEGVKGKYSLVPYPACVGWLDRELPGWSRRQLQDSLQLVRDLIVPNWDIHPEMITHTRVIDLQTGRPCEEISAATMENSFPQEPKSVDELAAYLAYALRILKNCGIPCEGVTTPGGFGNLVKPELSFAVQEAVRDVFAAEIPHYFKYIAGSGESCQPAIEQVRGLGTGDVKLTVNVVAATGDYGSGWDGDRVPEPENYITRDGTAGRVVDVINSGEPTLFFGHWAGLYSNGSRAGFRAFQQVVSAINEFHSPRIVWMKVSEIARYWAAKELTAIVHTGQAIRLDAPFACPAFTLRIESASTQPPDVKIAGHTVTLQRAADRRALQPSQWLSNGEAITICFDLPKGASEIGLK